MAGRRWVLVVIDGDGPMENPRVFGPWRNESLALAAKERLDKATGNADGFAYDLTTIEPEYGGRWSLTEFIKDAKESLR